MNKIPYEDVYWFFHDEYTCSDFDLYLEQAYEQDLSVRAFCKRLQVVRLISMLLHQRYLFDTDKMRVLVDQLQELIEDETDYIIEFKSKFQSITFMDVSFSITKLRENYKLFRRID